MYQTLDELEYVLTQPKTRFYKFSKIFRELKVLGLIFTVVFLWTYIITNAQLIIDNFNDHFSPQEVFWISENGINSSFNWQHWSAEEVENLVEQYGGAISMQQEVATDMDHYLQHSLNSYDFSFNLLPPTNRLIIPAINLDVPLVESTATISKDFTETSFDSDLENWVVKYPTTPNPWEEWNAFFFGHTSQEYWKNNPYGTVFRNIPQLKENDKIQIVRDWVLYEYKVITSTVVKPKEVNNTYTNFWNKNKEYITLMWCYPIWRIDKRMMIFAERI